MATPIIPDCGEIWDAVLDPIIGREQGGYRPVLVVSSNDFNRMPHELCFVAPITTRNRGLVTQVNVKAGTGGLDFDSVIMCDQTRAISLLRLRNKRGELDEFTLRRVQAIVHRILGAT